MAPDEFVLDVLGTQVGVQFTGPARMHAEAVMEPWARCLASGRDLGADIPRIRLLSGNRPAVADRLTRMVTLRAIEQQRHHLLMLHAGAVSIGERAIAFVAASGGGKTTAIRTLAARYGYLSDETTAIDVDLRVFPFPKPLSLLQPTVRWKQQLSPDAAAPDATPLASPTHDRPILHRLLILDRRDRIGRPYLSRLDLAEAMTTLAPQISYLSALPRPLLRLATLIEHCDGVLRVSYTEATELTGVVDELLEADPGAPGNDPQRVNAPVLRGHGWVADELELDTRVAVLVNNRLFILDGVGAAVWRALATSDDLDVVVERVTDDLGPPADGIDPAAAVRAAIAELRRSGLLRGVGDLADREPSR